MVKAGQQCHFDSVVTSIVESECVTNEGLLLAEAFCLQIVLLCITIVCLFSTLSDACTRAAQHDISYIWS